MGQAVVCRADIACDADVVMNVFFVTLAAYSTRLSEVVVAVSWIPV